jgi:hypothetical protein
MDAFKMLLGKINEALGLTFSKVANEHGAIAQILGENMRLVWGKTD